MWIRFVIYGFGGFCAEVVYTALVGLFFRKDLTLTGKTYLWMFPIYGLIAPLYEPVHNHIRDLNVVWRALIWSVGFTCVEWASGWIISKFIGRCPWDYRDKRFHINAYIRWDFFPLWAAVGLLMEPVHDYLVQLTPAIQSLF